MAQYFTERLQKVFHMIFTSYNQKMAQEGLRQLELIVNNQQGAVQTDHRALRNDMTTLLESDMDTKEDALKIANDPESRELGDAYNILAVGIASIRMVIDNAESIVEGDLHILLHCRRDGAFDTQGL